MSWNNLLPVKSFTFTLGLIAATFCSSHINLIGQSRLNVDWALERVMSDTNQLKIALLSEIQSDTPDITEIELTTHPFNPIGIMYETAVAKILEGYENQVELNIKHVLYKDSVGNYTGIFDSIQEINEAKRQVLVKLLYPEKFIDYIGNRYKYIIFDSGPGEEFITFNDADALLLSLNIDPDLINQGVNSGQYEEMWQTYFRSWQLTDDPGLDSIFDVKIFMNNEDLNFTFQDIFSMYLPPVEPDLCCDFWNCVKYAIGFDEFREMLELADDVSRAGNILIKFIKLGKVITFLSGFLDEVNSCASDPCTYNIKNDPLVERTCGMESGTFCYRFEENYWFMVGHIPTLAEVSLARCGSCPAIESGVNLNSLMSGGQVQSGPYFSIGVSVPVIDPDAVIPFGIRSRPVVKMDYSLKVNGDPVDFDTKIISGDMFFDFPFNHLIDRNTVDGTQFCLEAAIIEPQSVANQCDPIEECVTFNCPTFDFFVFEDQYGNKELWVSVDQNQDLNLTQVRYLTRFFDVNDVEIDHSTGCILEGSDSSTPLWELANNSDIKRIEI